MTIGHESVDVGAEGADAIRIRYVRIRDEFDGGGQLVVDRSHTGWLADELDAFANDPGRPRTLLEEGHDHLALYASGNPPSVWVLNARSPAPASPRETTRTLVLTVPYARKLATLLRDPEPARPMLARSVRGWAERLCGVASTSAQELAAALDGALETPPAGVTRIALDERELGLGGVDVETSAGALPAADMEHLFGPGQLLFPTGPRPWPTRAHRVRVPHQLLRCAVFADHRPDWGGDVWRVKLRPERLPPPTFVPRTPIEHESVHVRVEHDGVVRVRYVLVQDGRDQGGELVVDEANAGWLADELYAFAQDAQRPDSYRSGGDDDIKLFGGGHEMTPYVHVVNRRRTTPEGARVSALSLTAPYAQELAAVLWRSGAHRPV